MKKVLITSRLTKQALYDENHFSLDVRWLDFLSACHLTPIVLPPNLKIAKEIIKSFDCDGILLTGGGDIGELGGTDIDRDAVEECLIALSIRTDIPLIGVCRGMQKIQAYFGETNFERLEDNIAKQQKAFFAASAVGFLKNKKRSCKFINSYHHFGVKNNSVKDFEILAISNAGILKCIQHREKKIIGIMWHPEREHPFKKMDVLLFRGFYET
jgi:putative glutamine amidotransferase